MLELSYARVTILLACALLPVLEYQIFVELFVSVCIRRCRLESSDGLVVRFVIGQSSDSEQVGRS